MTAADIKRELSQRLKANGVDAADFEATQIIEFVLNRSIVLWDEAVVNQEQQSAIDEICSRRIKKEPLQYIFGQWEFYGLPFFVGEGVLIPRSDTERLVERALTFLTKGERHTVFDLCAGSGCIGIAIAKNGNSEVVFFEKSKLAIEYLKKNCELNSVDAWVFQCDVLENPPSNVEGVADIIVCNPPYIATNIIATLEKEVQCEPIMALDGGDDGLVFYKAITSKWKKALKPGGKLIFEIGFDQADAVSLILANEGFSEICVDKDYDGNDRVVYGTYKGL